MTARCLKTKNIRQSKCRKLWECQAIVFTVQRFMHVWMSAMIYFLGTAADNREEEMNMK